MTRRLNKSSCAIEVPMLKLTFVGNTLGNPVDLFDEMPLSVRPCNFETFCSVERVESIDARLEILIR
jgi:hypothetical protein